MSQETPLNGIVFGANALPPIPDRPQTAEELEVQAQINEMVGKAYTTGKIDESQKVTMPWPATFDPRTGKVYRTDKP